MKRWLVTMAVIASAGLAVVLAVGAEPLATLIAAVDASLGSWTAFQESLAKSVPLLWCGLAVAVAFRAGVWNIGAEGQLLVGATMATWVCLAVPAGPWSVPLGLLAGACGGAVWAAIAAVLRLVSRVNEILSTILLNLVAVAVVGWAVHGPLQEASGAYPQSDLIPAAAWLWRPFPPGRAHFGVLLAFFAAGLVALLLRWTTWGLELRATGDRPGAAAAVGIRTDSLQTVVLVCSGALAGIGGAVELAGMTHRLFENLSPGYGYSGIAVALVGGLNPLGTTLAALLFGGMNAAAGGMQRTAGVPAVAGMLIQGLVVIALAITFRQEH